VSFIPLSNVISITYTATADTPFKLTTAALWFSGGDMQILTNGAKIGDSNGQNLTVTANGIWSGDDFNLDDLFIKNAVAGQNTVINFTGILMTQKRKEELGVD